MQWKWMNLFEQHILQRGYRYYLEGAVQNLEAVENGFTATVEGSNSYEVSFRVKEKGVVWMRCSCPYARDGKKCKHMAALLYEIEGKYGKSWIDMCMPEGNKSTGQATRLSSKKAEHDEPLKNGSAKNKKQENVRLFPPPADDDYRYFDMSLMTRMMTFDAEEVEAAKKLIEEGKAVLQEPVRMGFSDYARGYVGQASGSIKHEIKGRRSRYQSEWESVFLNFSREGFERIGCYVSGCYKTYWSESVSRQQPTSVCRHVIAILILLGRYFEKNNPGDATDYQGFGLLKNCRAMFSASSPLTAEKGSEESHTDTALRQGMPIRLIPRLQHGRNGLELGFRIGAQKLYVVKNISDLIEAAETGQKMTLGKSNEIDFAADWFASESQLFYDFLKREYQEEESRMNRILMNAYGLNPGEQMKSSMQLYGNRLDEFYDLAQEYEDLVEVKADGPVKGESLLRLKEKTVEAKLTLAPLNGVNDRFEGVEILGELPSHEHGLKYSYILEGNTLYRAEKEKLAKLCRLLGVAWDYTFDEYIPVDISIGRNHLSEFMYRGLPALEEYADVEVIDGDRISKYLPPEAEFAFNLDIEYGNENPEGETRLICRADVIYDGQRFNLISKPNERGGCKMQFDLFREEEALKLLYRIFDIEIYGNVGMGAVGMAKRVDDDVLYAFMNEDLRELEKIGEVRGTDRFKRIGIRKAPKISVGVSVESQLLKLEIMSNEVSQEELLDILAAYRKKKTYFKLKSGEFVTLQGESLQQLSEIMESLRLSPKEFVAGKMELPAYRALYLDKMLEKNEDLYSRRDASWKALVKGFKTVGESDFEPPASLQNIMRGYQRYGYQWLRTLEQYGFGGILADDMGLGKTLQMIAVLLAAQQEKSNTAPSLIVCPASLVYNWAEEILRFAPSLRTAVITGSKSDRQKLLESWESYDVLITSYDLLKRDVDLYEGKCFFFHVLDEAQFIKTHNTAAAKAVKIIESKHRIALTGTPIENRLSELWSIFDFLMPGYLYGYETFRKELEMPITKRGESDKTERLKQMVSPFILRRLKQDVLKELPEKLEKVQYAVLPETQRRLYDAQVVKMRKQLEEASKEDFNKSRIKILAELMKLRQICCDPSLCFENYTGESAKREACMELITSAIEGEHKILVFSQFTSMLELLEADLREAGIAYNKITGATPKENRVEMVKSFNRDDTPVFLISLKAGGTGLNLTGADMVFHYDPWWNYAAQNQATDRAHRIGQEKVVTVCKLIAKDTIEEKILNLQQAKKDLAEEILSGDGANLMSMSKEELLELL